MATQNERFLLIHMNQIEVEAKKNYHDYKWCWEELKRRSKQ